MHAEVHVWRHYGNKHLGGVTSRSPLLIALLCPSIDPNTLASVAIHILLLFFRRLYTLHVLVEAHELFQELLLRVSWACINLYILSVGIGPFETGICPRLLLTFVGSNLIVCWARNLLVVRGLG